MDNATFEEAGFRERWSLATKHLAYAFSLDVSYRVLVSADTKLGLRLSAIESLERSTYHVLDDAIAHGRRGPQHDVPRARVVRGDDWMDLGRAGVGAVNGVLILQAPEDAAPLRIDYRGIARLPRGFDRVHDDGRVSQVPGTACIATRQVCEDPKYRWLVDQELFGFGQVFLEHDACKPAQPGTAGAVNRLRFSFDLYSDM